MCGSPAELNSTGAAECYGKAWQTMWIECTKTVDENCAMDMIISADFFDIRNGEEVIIEAWNKLDRKTK
jgi:hypothetical protein